MLRDLDLQSRARGALLGLAVGDAVGTTLEFARPGSFRPIDDMVGGGPFGLPPGCWTDDTSMALCLAESLLSSGGFDARDQMNRYMDWYRCGYQSSTGACFDIGETVRRALERFAEEDLPFAGSTDPWSAGNGSIMRLAPVVLFAFPHRARTIELAAESSRTTHAAAECLEACQLLGAILFAALQGQSKEEVLRAGLDLSLREERVAELAHLSWLDKPAHAIRGTGYVIESLEAALWCFASTESFREAVLAAANLGDDADTTAAVCGQIAGAFHGVDAIPAAWRERVHNGREIESLASRLVNADSAER